VSVDEPAGGTGDDGGRDGEKPRHRHASGDPSAEPTPAPAGATSSPRPAPGSRARDKGWGTRSHLLVALLCALLGFAIVVQVRQTRSDEFALLRQDDLVRLLDEITIRNDQLESEQAQLTLDRNDLRSGADAQAVAERNAEVQGILAGTVPVQGPGVELLVREQGRVVPASAWVNLVEELRNAGAEAIEIDGVRVGASTWFSDVDGGVVVDGVALTSPITVLAIGDPQTIDVALQIPGGALATLRTNDALTTLDSRERVEILAVRELTAPQEASPVPDDAASPG
jgi:uncharacterized protein YlxW (UPF0749 family)